MQSRAICPKPCGAAMSREEKIALYKKQRKIESEQKSRVKELEKAKLEEWYSECDKEPCNVTLHTDKSSTSTFEKQEFQQQDKLDARVLLLEEKLSSWSAAQNNEPKSLEIHEREYKDSENIRELESRVQRLEKLTLQILNEISGKNAGLELHLSSIEKKIDSRNDFFERRVFDLEATCRLQKKLIQGLTHDSKTDELSMVTSMLSLPKLTNGSSVNNIQKYPSFYWKTHNGTKLNSANKNGKSLHNRSGSTNDKRNYWSSSGYHRPPEFVTDYIKWKSENPHARNSYKFDFNSPEYLHWKSIIESETEPAISESDTSESI